MTDYKQRFKDHVFKYVLSVTDNQVMFYPVEDLEQLNAVKLALIEEGYKVYIPCLIDKDSVPLKRGFELLRIKQRKPPFKSYCTQNDSDCSTCSLKNYGRDCKNNLIDKAS